MILYLGLAVFLVLTPYLWRVRRFASPVGLVLAAFFGYGGIQMIRTSGSDGVLVGSVFLLVGLGFVWRAYWTKRAGDHVRASSV